MKNKTFTIVCLLLMCYGNFDAQNYTVSTISNNVKITNQLHFQNSPMPEWEKHWSEESIIAINKIIEEYGYPDENSPNRMHWIIPGDTKRTITYTENFLFYVPFESISCNEVNAELIVEIYHNR